MADARPRCSNHVVFPDENCHECIRAERDALRALLERVLSCGLNEEPHGVGFAPSKQEKRAGELARDIAVALRKGE